MDQELASTPAVIDRGLLRPARVLLIVPPLAWLERPAIGVHLLQAIARSVGVEVQILYAGVLFAARFGERTYNALAKLQYGMLLGERLFCRAAFGGPALGRDECAHLRDTFAALQQVYERNGRTFHFELDRLLALEAEIPAWMDGLAAQIAAAGYAAVGATSSFEQNTASLAILQRVKARAPRVLTLLGGANCEGEMADGLAALAPWLDCIFSGESEATFLEFLGDLGRGAAPSRRIWHGRPCLEMDALPTPDYGDYYAQVRALLPGSSMLNGGGCYLPYESSRGCWWGQKSHCTFCGLNGGGMVFREKSPDRVIDELRVLCAAHPTRQITITDNIMPHAYFRTLLPRLPQELPGLSLMYEEKANLTLTQVLTLRAAGVSEIQPGIEALSTGLLRLMAKGTTAAQNIALLRYARVTGLVLQWNLLYGFPNDLRSHYDETLELLPLLRHLPPPKRANPVILDRFSPYHSHPERFGITGLVPMAAYFDIYPEDAQVARLAYHFNGTFASAAIEHPEIIRCIAEEVAAWRARHHAADGPATLEVVREGSGWALLDTRGLAGCPEREQIDEAQAAAALTQTPRGARDGAWALERRVAVERDGRIVPLATAAPELLLEMEARRAARGATWTIR